MFLPSFSGFLDNPSNPIFWGLWAVILLWQNFAFTEVSRARSSASLTRHMRAALMSNGVWFIQSLFVYSTFLAILTGKYGWRLAAFAALWYTAFTMSGSIYAHWRALKKESGKTAVGASAKYAQIPTAEWQAAQRSIDAVPGLIEEFKAVKDAATRATQLAEQAYDIQLGTIPNAGTYSKANLPEKTDALPSISTNRS